MFLAGCDAPAQPKAGGETAKAASGAPTLPEKLFASTEPADAKAVADAKRAAAQGDTVVIRGRIAGAVEPFVKGRAMFTLADASLPFCSEMKMADACKTPWDLCCEPKDVIAEQTATIQIVGADGKPLKLDLDGQGSLKPGATVTVKGRVTKKDGDKVFVVDASEVFVKS